MQVKDIMTTNVAFVLPESSLKEAARIMKCLDIGALPVCNEKRLLGMITDRDIAVRSVAEGAGSENTRVMDIMTNGVHWCFDDVDVEEAAQKMAKAQVRRLVVINREKRLTGIVSLADLARNGATQLACEALEQICKPPREPVTQEDCK